MPERTKSKGKTLKKSEIKKEIAPSKETKIQNKKPVNKSCTIKNNTNQKQVTELDGKHLAFNAYEEKKFEFDEATAKDKFGFLFAKNILKLKK